MKKNENGITRFCRRVLILLLIENGVDSVARINKATGIPRRTLQDSVKSLGDYGCRIEYSGSRRTGSYKIVDWGGINRQWGVDNIAMICEVVGVELVSVS